MGGGVASHEDVEDSCRMRRSTPATREVAVAALVLWCVVLGSCTGGAAREPTVSSVNFTPKLVLEVDEEGFRWRRGPREDPSVTVPPDNMAPTVYRGTVMDVVNTGERDHWIDGGKAFDTGQLRPGEKTVVALTEDLTETKSYDITDRLFPGRVTSIVVQPRPET